MLVTVAEGYRAWAPAYDAAPNPLLALESRVLGTRLGSLAGVRVLDAGAGSGRWMRYVAAEGAVVFGVDLSPEMLCLVGMPERVAVADIRNLPFRADAVDLAICSFALSYLPSPDQTIHKLARVARRVVITDMHPAAMAAGWSRSFRVEDRRYEIEHYAHTDASLCHAASAAGLTREWKVEAGFGEPERAIFAAAGKSNAFDALASIPAITASCWRRA